MKKIGADTECRQFSLFLVKDDPDFGYWHIVPRGTPAIFVAVDECYDPGDLFGIGYSFDRSASCENVFNNDLSRISDWGKYTGLVAAIDLQNQDDQEQRGNWFHFVSLRALGGINHKAAIAYKAE